MNKSNKRSSNAQDSKINELMQSIESKLQLLAKDQFEPDLQFNHSQPGSLNYQMLSPHKSANLQLQQSNFKSQLGSPILSRISQIEEKYLSKLTVLNQKTTILQNENNELKAINRKLQKQLDQERQKLSIMQSDQERILDRKVDEMKQNLLNRMKEQVESEIQGYIRELSQMREQIGKERLQRKKLQKEIELVRFERNNFQQMYMDILNKFKQYMKSEVNSYQQKQANLRQENIVQSNLISQDRILYHQKYKEEPKKKEKTKRKKTSQLPRQKLIPYLAKGIDELKQKLNLK